MDKKLFIGATLVTATVIGGLVYYRHIKRREREPDEIVQVDIGGVPHNVPQSVLNKIEEALVHPEVAVARAVLSRENQAIRNQLIREAERLEREGQ